MATQAAVKQYNANLAEEAARIIRETLPARIAKLSRMVDSGRWAGTDVSSIAVDVPMPRAALLATVGQAAAAGATAGAAAGAGAGAPAADGAPSAKKRKTEGGAAEPAAAGESKGAEAPAAAGEAKAAEPDPLARIEPNAALIALMNELKPDVLESLQLVGTMKMWIQLLIPRMEDGNNFGVAVQEECLGELGRVEDAGFSALESMSKYFQTRGKMVAKYQKHSSVMDYRHSIMECDALAFFNLRLVVVSLRNNYMVVLDLLQKNLALLKQPRGTTSVSQMYE